jgi:quinol-cytochrome oxidoreductase complex cytochrome b subunit
MEQTHKSEDSIPFYPDHVRTEFRVVLGILAIAVIIGIAGMINPVGIGDPADPLNTPTHVKPEWYFLGLYQLLKFIPKTTGAVAPVILLAIITIWPFIDRKPDRSPQTTKIRFIASAIAIIIMIALTIWGEVS